MFKKVKITASALLFLAVSSSSATTLLSEYRSGVTPSWIKDCQQAQKYMNDDSLQDLNKCNSIGYVGYRDSLDYYSTMYSDGSYTFRNVRSAHIVVTDIKQDRNAPDYGTCESEMCYRAYVYINGNENTGTLVATWVTSPGKPWYDGSGGAYTPESLYVYQTRPAKNQNSQGHFRLEKDIDMGLAGQVTGKFPGYYVMDHYRNSDNEDMPWATFYHKGVAFHSSPTVTGDTASHGCTRLKYIEAKKMNYLARHVKRNFTVETRYTNRGRYSNNSSRFFNNNNRRSGGFIRRWWGNR